MGLWTPRPPKEEAFFRFRNQRIWATEGMVCVEDQLSGEFQCLAVEEALARASALNAQVSHMHYIDERDAVQTCVENLLKTCRAALDQGDPMDPEIARQKAREGRRSRAGFANLHSPVRYTVRSGGPGFLLQSEDFKTCRI